MKEAYIEDIALQLEQTGMTRMAGRMLGALLVADPAEQSAEDLMDTLQASRGSISSSSRYLIQLGLIERVSIPGERRDYFRNKPGAWVEMTRQGLVQARMFREMAERGLGLINSTDPEVRRGLEEMRDFYAFVEKEFPQVFERWEALKGRGQKLEVSNSAEL